jgi:hypothetical protein
MVSQSDIELLAEVAGMGPEKGGISVFFPIAFADILGRWQNPRDHRNLFGPLTFSKSQLKDLLGSEMISSDNLLVLPKKGVVSGSKSNKGLIPIPSSVHLATVGRTLLGELNNRFFNEFLWIFGERRFLHRIAPFQLG